MPNKIAGMGQVFVCSVCGKRSRDLYGDSRIDSEWDESCTMNAVLCDEKTLSIVKEGVVKTSAAKVFKE